MRVAVFSNKPYDQDYFEQYLGYYDFSFTYFDTQLNKETASLTQSYDAVCVFVNDQLDKDTIQILSENNIQLIALRCAGFNNVDLDAAKKCSIKVVRVPAYSPESIVEHTIALILALNRKTHKAYNRVREGNFSINNLMGFNVYGKKVGVIGTGKIGATFCKTIMGFGCKVLAYDVFESEELKELGVKYLPLESIFNESDIISLHCPLTPQTMHLINNDALSKMKNGVMIINTSRGALINTADVIQGLINKKIGYLGIDVYEQEENLFFNDLSERIIEDEYLLRLNSFPNVLITSHQAYFTKEAMREITLTTLENIKAFHKGEELINEISR